MQLVGCRPDPMPNAFFAWLVWVSCGQNPSRKDVKIDVPLGGACNVGKDGVP